MKDKKIAVLNTLHYNNSMKTTTFPIGRLHEVEIKLQDCRLRGNLYLVEGAKGIVAFAHGSGSSRLSPRNQYVAKALNQAKLSTLLFDLLTTEEDTIDQQTTEYRFNIPLLAERLVATTDWLVQQPQLKALNIGYFGSSTGAAAALIAAAQRPKVAKAVVSRGGRPDLADTSLPQVKAPTLLIVGGLDTQVIELNQAAQAQMTAKTKFAIVPGATHLFEEPGTLDQVTQLAAEWFQRYLD